MGEMSNRQLVDDATDRQELLDRIAELEAEAIISQRCIDACRRSMAEDAIQQSTD